MILFLFFSRVLLIYNFNGPICSNPEYSKRKIFALFYLRKGEEQEIFLESVGQSRRNINYNYQVVTTSYNHSYSTVISSPEICSPVYGFVDLTQYRVLSYIY